MSTPIRKCMIIVTTNGSKVVRNVEGDSSRYHPSYRETVIYAKASPLTKQEQARELEMIGILGKAPEEIKQRGLDYIIRQDNNLAQCNLKSYEGFCECLQLVRFAPLTREEFYNS